MDVRHTYIYYIQPCVAIPSFPLNSAGRARFAHQLVMTYKHRRRANTAKPANTGMPMFLPTNCETPYGSTAESELLYVRLATLPRSQQTLVCQCSYTAYGSTAESELLYVRLATLPRSQQTLVCQCSYTAYGSTAESELLYVRLATLPRSKDRTKSDAIRALIVGTVKIF